MADLRVRTEADELAVALVQALARQDGERALALVAALEPLIGDRPLLRARHASWAAQAHQMHFLSFVTRHRSAVPLYVVNSRQRHFVADVRVYVHAPDVFR